MHSSRMQTSRSLAIYGGCTWSLGEVPGLLGVYLVFGGCTWSWGCVPRWGVLLGVLPVGGVLLVGGVLPGVLLGGGCVLLGGGLCAPGWGVVCSWVGACVLLGGGLCAPGGVLTGVGVYLVMGVYLVPGGVPGHTPHPPGQNHRYL